MFQSEFLPLQPLPLNITYVGGLVKFWYIPIEDILVFPRVGGNQRLVAEPTLRPGKSWFGPLEIPRDKLGYSESLKRSKAGPYYEQKIEGAYIGDSPESTITLENMPYHRFLVVGKVRAGGFYKLYGSPSSWMDFNAEFKSGNGPSETAQTAISFTTEQLNKALILPSFAADTTAQAIGGAGGGTTMAQNNKETIAFENQSVINVPWTQARYDKFGSLPIVQIWIVDGSEPATLFSGGSIELDQPPPAFTELVVRIGVEASGYIVIE